MKLTEDIKEYKRKWREKNKERCLEKERVWKQKHPERVRAHTKKGNKKLYLEYPEKRKCWRFSYRKREGKCVKCGSEENLCFHHTDYEKDEGFTVCRGCHIKIHRRHEE